MATYKITRGITFKLVRETPPAELANVWQGEIFADGSEGRKKYGRCDELRIGQLTGFKFAGDVRRMVWGDFTSIRYRRVR